MTIELPGMIAFALAVDKSNALYVSWFSLSSFGIEIYKYPTEGSSGGANLNLDLPSYVYPAYGIAFDRAGNLVVPCENLTHNPPKYLAVFPPGATQPSKKIKEAGLMDVVTGASRSRTGTRNCSPHSGKRSRLAGAHVSQGGPARRRERRRPDGLALSP